MINNVLLVGRIVKLKEIDKTIMLAIPKSIRNKEGIYETDFIDVYLEGNLSKSVFTFCKKGDVIGIKGYLDSQDKELKVMAVQVSYIAQGKGDDLSV